ncbi:MAG: DNRLRE domain-containing protein [Anaerolineae bacterium]|nr:DNRLRE domain-containing protein [Anaerolineae bacterium]
MSSAHRSAQKSQGGKRFRLLGMWAVALLLALALAHWGPSTWAQPHQNALRDTINTPVPTPTNGPTSTPTLPPGPGVSRLLLREGVDGYTGTEDTWMYSYTPRFPQPLDGGLKIKGAEIQSVLIRFDLEGKLPQGANIVQAELLFYVDAFQESRPLDIAIYRVLRPWDESEASWNYVNTAQRVRWGSPGCNAVGVDRVGTPDDTITLQYRAVYKALDVTQSVRYWVDHSEENFGWLVKGVSASTAGYSFASSRHSMVERRPLLRIDYTAEGVTPSPTVSPVLTSTPTPSGRVLLVEVYEDRDRDGFRDEGEPGLPGARITLLDIAHQVLAHCWTDAEGHCAFTGLTEGWYRVREQKLPGYLSSTADEVLIYLGGEQVQATFGDYPAMTRTPTPTRTLVSPGGKLLVRVYCDEDRDGFRDGGEPGLAGAQVMLFDMARQVLAQCWSDAEGHCIFAGLAEGWYRVREQDPPGYLSSTADEVLIYLGGEQVQATFGDYPLVTRTPTPSPTPTRTPAPSGGDLLVRVYRDDDRDSWLDSGEPGLAGAGVQVWDQTGSRMVERGVTGADGLCHFAALGQGWYRVREYDPWGYLSSTEGELFVYVGDGQIELAFGDYPGGAVALPLLLK